jgi:hypothetical protein
MNKHHTGNPTTIPRPAPCRAVHASRFGNCLIPPSNSMLFSVPSKMSLINMAQWCPIVLLELVVDEETWEDEASLFSTSSCLSFFLPLNSRCGSGR